MTDSLVLKNCGDGNGHWIPIGIRVHFKDGTTGTYRVNQAPTTHSTPAVLSQ